MSCHTWGYKSIDLDLTDQDLKVGLLNKLQNLYDTTIDIINGKNPLETENKYYPYKSKEIAELGLIRWKWMLDNCNHSDDYKINYDQEIKNEVKVLSKEAELFILKYTISLDIPVIYNHETNKFYIIIKDYGDNMFRCFDYNQKYLLSREETLEFVNNIKNNVEEVNLNLINEFWDKYPDGLIDFG